MRNETISFAITSQSLSNPEKQTTEKENRDLLVCYELPSPMGGLASASSFGTVLTT